MTSSLLSSFTRRAVVRLRPHQCRRLSSASDALSRDAYILDPKEHRGTVIWLPGTHDDLKAAPTLFTLITPEHVRTVVPTPPEIPISILNDDEDMAWFDLLEDNVVANPDHDEDEMGMRESVARVHDLLDEECRRVDSTRIILAGQSHGGALAILAGLEYYRPLAGIVCVGGYAPVPHLFPDCVHEANRHTSVLALVSKQDRRIPVSYAAYRFGELHKAGVRVELRVQDDPFASQQLLQVQNWWLKRITTPHRSTTTDNTTTTDNNTSQQH